MAKSINFHILVGLSLGDIKFISVIFSAYGYDGKRLLVLTKSLDFYNSFSTIF
jgi:hypothetical protein